MRRGSLRSGSLVGAASSAPTCGGAASRRLLRPRAAGSLLRTSPAARAGRGGWAGSGLRRAKGEPCLQAVDCRQVAELGAAVEVAEPCLGLRVEPVGGG